MDNSILERIKFMILLEGKRTLLESTGIERLRLEKLGLERFWLETIWSERKELMMSRLESFELNYKNSVGENKRGKNWKKITSIGKDGIGLENSRKRCKKLLE